MKVVRDDRLRGAAEADLVRHDDAESFFAQNLNGPAEIKAAEVHPVEQHHGPAVGLPAGGTSIYAMRTSCPYMVSGRYATGYG